MNINNIKKSMKYEKINILCFIYLITWAFIPVFAYYTSGTLFRFLYAGVIIIWFITGLKNLSKNMLVPLFSMFCFLVIIFIYYSIGYGDIRILDFISYILVLSIGINSTVYIRKLSFYRKNKIKKYVMILIFITLCTTVNVLLKNSNAARLLTSSSTNIEIVTMLEKENVASFDFIYGIVIFLPVLFYSIFFCKKKLAKIFYLIVLFLVLLCIFKANFTTAYILFLIEIVLYLFFSSKSFFGKILTILLFVIILLFGKQIIIFYLNFLIDNTTSILSQQKLIEIINIFKGEGNISQATSRMNLILQNIDSFIEKPILGQGAYYNAEAFKYIGRHSQFLDELARYGLLGGGFLFYFLFSCFYQIYDKINNKNYRRIYVISTIIFFMLGFLNPIFNNGILMFYFIVVPFFIK